MVPLEEGNSPFAVAAGLGKGIGRNTAAAPAGVLSGIRRKLLVVRLVIAAA